MPHWPWILANEEGCALHLLRGFVLAFPTPELGPLFRSDPRGCPPTLMKLWLSSGTGGELWKKSASEHAQSAFLPSEVTSPTLTCSEQLLGAPPQPLASRAVLRKGPPATPTSGLFSSTCLCHGFTSRAGSLRGRPLWPPCPLVVHPKGLAAHWGRQEAALGGPSQLGPSIHLKGAQLCRSPSGSG